MKKQASPLRQKSAIQQVLRQTAEGALLLLTLLLPLKFGVFGVVPEVTSFFPDSLLALLVVNWPAVSFGIASAVVLLLVLVAWPEAAGQTEAPTWRFGALWSIGVLLAALPGWWNATTWDFPYMQMAHFAGIGAYVAAAGLYCLGEPKGARRLLLTLAVGTLLLTWSGLEQYFWGFERSRQYLLDQEAQGISMGHVIKARTFDDRVFATFTSCNSLAGYLLLVWPLLLAELWRWGGRVEPVKWSRLIFLTLGGGGALAVLLLTKSRAAYLALLLTGALFALCWPMRRRWKMLLVMAAVLTVAGGAYYIHYYGRGFESMAARADYLRSSLLLWWRHPLAGCGWGEFFFGHMRLKAIVSDEAAHDPHNILMTGAQAGTLLVAVLAVGLLYPVMNLLRGLRREAKQAFPLETIAGLFGITAFMLHSMMDLNVQVPGIMAAFGAVGAALLAREYREEQESLSDLSGTATRKGAGHWKNIAGVSVLVLLALYSGWAGVRLLHSERMFDRLIALCSMRNKTPEQAAAIHPGVVQAALEEVVRLRPHSSFPWSTAADFMLARGRWGEAERMIEEALRRAPGRAALHQRKALIALHRGDMETAHREMQRVRELFPHNPAYQSLPEETSGDAGGGENIMNGGWRQHPLLQTPKSLELLPLSRQP